MYLSKRDTILSSINKTKTMPKLLINKLFPLRKALSSVGKKPLAVIALLLVITSFVAVPRIVQAVTCSSTADCQQQKDALIYQNSLNQQQLNALVLQAQGYKGAINTLQSQIYQMQQQIAANQAQQASIQQQITANELLIVAKKQSLSEIIKSMYIDGQMTTIEQLATSNDLSTYVDKQVYRKAVQNQLTSTLNEIAALQASLHIQKAQIDQILVTDNNQNAQLAAAQSQQQQLLSMTQSQQDTYNSQISTNQKQIAALQQQQAALIQNGTRNVLIPAPSGGSGGACDVGYGNGGYPMPWCAARQDTVPTIPYSSDWINRECTSYVYWYFTQMEGHTDLRVSGNANNWLNSNYTAHDSPAVGAIAVETTGYYGHVAIVQALPGQTYAGNTVPDGYVLVSEMNYDWNGHFRYSFSPLSKFQGYVY